MVCDEGLGEQVLQEMQEFMVWINPGAFADENLNK